MTSENDFPQDSARARTARKGKDMTKRPRKTGIMKKLVVTAAVIAFLGCAFVLVSNLLMTVPARSRIRTAPHYYSGTGSESGGTGSWEGYNYEAILVLGCSVRPDGSPSDMLADRLDAAIELYDHGVAPMLLLSGDQDVHYDEIAAMRAYAEAHGVPPEAIGTDGKGYSTFDSMYRARYEFGLKKILVVTQAYHLPRALYIGRYYGIDAEGAMAADVRYSGQWKRDIREIAARSKDLLQCFLRPGPEPVPEPAGAS